MIEILSQIITPSLIYATIRSATPVILAGLCASITMQAGILNLGTEGIMLTGAFVAASIGYVTGSWMLGIVAAMITGAIIALLLAFGNLRYNASMPAIAMGMNLMALAVTRYLLVTIWGVAGTFSLPGIPKIPSVNIPFLNNIPILNQILNNWVVTEWFGLILTAILYVIVFKTPFGLRLRSVGKMEKAAITAGVDTLKMKYGVMLFSGLIGGLAGAHLSLGYSNMFVQNMTNNRGFVGVAAMWFGGGHPVFTTIGGLVFGFFDSFSSRLQPFGFPSQLVLAIPYVVIILVLSLVLLSNKIRNKHKMSSLIKN